MAGNICHDDKAALELLCMLFQKKSVHNCSLYIYEEYEVIDTGKHVCILIGPQLYTDD